MQTTHVVEEAATIPHDSPLPRVHSLRSDEGSITLHELMVKKLENRIRSSKAKRRVRLIVSEDEEVYIAEPDISIANVPVSTAGAEVSTASPEKKTKLQLEQERLGYEEALRLQEQLDEKERQRIARVHVEANTFNAEEWDNIQAQIEADEELAQKLQVEERGKFFEFEKARLLVEMINERKRSLT
ncbi:hypothetical protein Tco_1451784 [Tanacetum coccineum]